MSSVKNSCSCKLIIQVLQEHSFLYGMLDFGIDADVYSCWFDNLTFVPNKLEACLRPRRKSVTESLCELFMGVILWEYD